MLNPNFKERCLPFMRTAASLSIAMAAVEFILAFIVMSPLELPQMRPWEKDRIISSLEVGNSCIASSQFDGYETKWWWEFNSRPFKLEEPIITNNSQQTVPLIVFRNNLFALKIPRHPPKFFNATYLNCSLPYLQPSLDCQFTFDTNYLSQADAVVKQMHNWNRAWRPRVPEGQRRQDQIWVFLNWESPFAMAKVTAEAMNKGLHLFNWTMTYRLDSNVLYSYGHFAPLEVPDCRRKRDRYSEKSEMAVVMTSNCHSNSGREDYLDELVKAGISIDQFGLCNGKELKRKPRPEECIRTKLFSTDAACENLLSSKYKFYLAFENALCHDYLSEKFFRAASLDSIPVVLNGADMSLFAPNGSYIDAKDFASPKELAQYMKKVASDKDLYNSFFWWKPFYDVEKTWEGKTFHKNLCHLCQRLHDYKASPRQSHSYTNISEWFFDQANCRYGKAHWL